MAQHRELRTWVRERPWILVVVTVALIALIFWQLYEGVEHTRFVNSGLSASGTVVSTSAAQVEHDSASATITFKDHMGEVHTFTESLGGELPSLKPGEEVEVAYSASNPDDARLKGSFLRGYVAIAFWCGLALAGLAYIWWPSRAYLRNAST